MTDNLEQSRQKKVSILRPVIIGLLLIPVNIYGIIQIDFVIAGSYPDILALLFNVVFILFVLVILNLLLRKILPGLALTQADLLVIYVMLCPATVLAGYDMGQTLVELMGDAFWFATPENEWGELFLRYFPKWLVVENKEVLAGLYRGESSLYTTEHVMAWLIPVISWTSFITVLLFVMLCINVILRKQWIETEKLTYPITQLPFEMTKEGAPLLKSKYMWLGFAIAGGICLLNGFSFLNPVIPSIPIKGPRIAFSEKPWSAINAAQMRITFFPFAIGLGFLMPLGLSFSYWFLYLFWQAERILGSTIGLSSFPGFPYAGAQVRGAWIGLFMFLLWTSRRYFWGVLKKAFIGDPKVDDSDEPLSYRTAVVGIIVGMFLIILFCHHAGMSIWVAALFFTTYFAMATTITRIRAELGPPTHDLYRAGPDHIMTDTFGMRKLGHGNLSMFSLFYWITHMSSRAHPMPHQLEAFKLAERAKISNRQICFAMLLATVVGALSAFWVIIHVFYRVGMENPGMGWSNYGRWCLARLESWMQYPGEVDHAAIFFSVIGMIFSLGLMTMRARFLWWPLHSVGYILTSWWVAGVLWFPIFLSWGAKKSVLKYGGIKAYRRAVPLFFGLILGDFIVGMFWNILGVALGKPMYNFWW